MKLALLIGLGGFLGSISRYAVGQFIHKFWTVSFPLGTFAVNILGCLLIGIIYAMSERRDLLSPELRQIVAIGFCGGFTTFSAFSFELLNLLRFGQYIYFLTYLIGSLILGILFVFIGYGLLK